jgi:hypothetical protein
MGGLFQSCKKQDQQNIYIKLWIKEKWKKLMAKQVHSKSSLLKWLFNSSITRYLKAQAILASFKQKLTKEILSLKIIQMPRA